MWHYIILNVALSVLAIVVAHQLWEYLKSNYSTKRTKNLLECQTNKYKSIVQDLTEDLAQDLTEDLAQDLTETSSRIRPRKSVSNSLSNSVSNGQGVGGQGAGLAEPPEFLSPGDKSWMVDQLAQFLANS